MEEQIFNCIYYTSKNKEFMHKYKAQTVIVGNNLTVFIYRTNINSSWVAFFSP